MCVLTDLSSDDLKEFLISKLTAKVSDVILEYPRSYRVSKSIPENLSSIYSFVNVPSQGVKKLGLSLEHSYDIIRKFLLHHLQSGLQALQLHLGDVLGMSRWFDQFGELGLSEAIVQRCINYVGTLALKSQEMLQ